MDKRGLFNLGNTCYLNSALQALRHAGPFREYFTHAWKTHRHPERNGYEFAANVSELLAEFSKGEKGPVNPKALVQSFFKVAAQRDQEDEFHFGAQADGTEAVLFILQVLHEQQARHVKMEINGVPKSPSQIEYVKSMESWASFFHKEYSPIVDAFYGQNQTTRTCSCGASRIQYEPWGVLKLPIPNAEIEGAPAPTLQQCINENFAPETLDDYTCETCKVKGQTKTQNRISRFPSHMILGLKRYTKKGAKVRAKIPYDPDLIDFEDWVTWPTLQPKFKYRVYATIDQLGTSSGGHYNMRAREGSSWTLYDDQHQRTCPNGECTYDTLMLFLERH